MEACNRGPARQALLDGSALPSARRSRPPYARRGRRLQPSHVRSPGRQESESASPSSEDHRFDLSARGSPWGLSELAQSWSLGRLFSGEAPPASLAPLDAALVGELGGSTGALDVLLRRCESEILQELSSFPADKLPRKRVPSQAAFVRVPFVSEGDLGPTSTGSAWRMPLTWDGWGTGSSTLAVRIMLMTSNALAVATLLNRQPRPRRGGLLVLVPPSDSGGSLPALSGALTALWRDAPFALDEWDALSEVCSSTTDESTRPGAVLLFALYAPEDRAASTPPHRVLSAIEALQQAGQPFVLATLFLDTATESAQGSAAASPRQAAEDSVRALLAQLQLSSADSKAETLSASTAASSPRALASQLNTEAAVPVCEPQRLGAYVTAAEVMLMGNTEDDVLREAVALARTRLEAERVAAAMRSALAAPDASTESGLPQLRETLAAAREFAARDPPLTRGVASTLNTLTERVSGRCTALSQVAAARDALTAALAPHTNGADTLPESVSSAQVDSLIAALDAAAACAWPWQLAQQVEFAQSVRSRWLAVRTLHEEAVRQPPDIGALSAALRTVVSNAPDVDVTAPTHVLAMAEAQLALDSGDQRLGAYHSAVSAAWQDGLLTPGSAAILEGLRESLRISPVEHEVVLRKSGALDRMAAATTVPGSNEPAGSRREDDPPLPTADSTWRSVAAGVRYNEALVLGVGSHGTYVFRGTVALTSRAQHPVAVKRIPRAPGDDGRRVLQLVEREVELLRLLSGAPAVVGFHAWCVTEDHLFIATELCAESLSQHVRRQPDLALDKRLSLCRQAAGAVAWLHDLRKPQGAVAHNDLKPNNFLCSLAGAVKVADFGLAVPLNPPPMVATDDGDGVPLVQQYSVPPSERDTEDDAFSMTTFAQYGVELNMAHRAPEVQAAAPRLTSAVDVWSLGLVLFYVLTGGQDAHNAHGQVDLSPLMRVGPPRTSLEARHLIACTLANDPRRRPTAAAVLRHPLFWSPSQALRACKEVHDTGIDAEAQLMQFAVSAGAGGGDAQQGALLMAALCDLQGWQARISPLFFERMASFVESTGAMPYEDTFAGLLRLVRNAVEHPPTGAEANAMRATLAELSPRPGRSGRLNVAARKALLGEYLLVLFPTLSIACWELGARPAADDDNEMETALTAPSASKAKVGRKSSTTKAIPLG